MKNNVLSQQLISEEYNESVAQWNIQNSILHESILYQKQKLSISSPVSVTLTGHEIYLMIKNLSIHCLMYGKMYKCKTHASFFSVTPI